MIDAAVSSGGYHTVKLVVFFNNPIMTCGHSMTRPSTKIQTRRGGGLIAMAGTSFAMHELSSDSS